MTQLIKSVSIENMLNQRQAVIELLTQARDLLDKADALAAQAHLGSLGEFFSSNGRSRHNVEFLKPTGITGVTRAMDANGWQYLMSESGMRSLMDATARSDWDKAIHDFKHPELNMGNVLATFDAMHGGRLDMFERGVVHCFKRLSWHYKTNQPVKFGKRIIMNNLLQVWGTGKNYYSSIANRATDELDDLVRVMSILDGKPEPDHRHAMYSNLAQVPKGETSWKGPYFELKWFKKGSGHLNFIRPELVDKMNLIIAKHYPDALPDGTR